MSYEWRIISVKRNSEIAANHFEWPWEIQENFTKTKLSCEMQIEVQT